MNTHLFQFLQLTFAIFLMSSSGVLGRYIALPTPVTIWIRSVIAVITLFLILKALKKSTFIGWGRHFRIVLISSIFLGAHWIAYFSALQASNVAIAMLSMFTYPIMTAMLEPVLLKTKFDKGSLVLSFIGLVGVFFLVPDLNFDNTVTRGVLLGLLAGFFYAIRNILMKKNLTDHGGLTLMYYQMAIITLLLWPATFIYKLDFNAQIIHGDWEALLILGLVTTAFGHTLFVRSLKNFTVTTVSILSCLTPLLGTLLAVFILDEIPKGQTVLAGTIILLTAGLESYRSVQQKKRS